MVLDHADQHAADDVDGGDDQAGRRRRRARTWRRRPWRRRRWIPAPDPCGAGGPRSRRSGRTDRSASMAICLPGMESRVKRAATSAIRPEPLVITTKFTTTRMAKTITPMTKLPCIISLPKVLDDRARRRPVPSWPWPRIRRVEAMFSAEPEQGRDQQHGREGGEFQRLPDHQGGHQDQHRSGDRHGQQQVQQEGRDRQDQQDDDPDDAHGQAHFATGERAEARLSTLGLLAREGRFGVSHRSLPSGGTAWSSAAPATSHAGLGIFLQLVAQACGSRCRGCWPRGCGCPGSGSASSRMSCCSTSATVWPTKARARPRRRPVTARVRRPVIGRVRAADIGLPSGRRTAASSMASDPGRQQHRAVHGVFQLADIAGPAVSEDAAAGLLRQRAFRARRWPRRTS